MEGDLLKLVPAVGCRVELRALLDRGLGVEAVTISREDGLVIWVDDVAGPDEPPWVTEALGREASKLRAGFRVAHELGHCLFYRSGRPPRRRRPPDHHEEQWCDRFAAALLAGKVDEAALGAWFHQK